MMFDEDTNNNAGVECPYCGHVHEDSYALFLRDAENDKVVRCKGCEKVFIAALRSTHTYLGKKSDDRFIWER